MNDFLVSPDYTVPEHTGRFEKFNLKENPFPSTPIINCSSDDIRYNGEIFEEAIRDKEMTSMRENFLSVSQSDPNHYRLGYIMDTSYVGRGNGKSSFSLNMLKKINTHYCLDFSNNKNKCFGLYISPQPSGRTKSIYNLLDLVFEEIYRSGIFEYCLASIRLSHILKLKPEFDLKRLPTNQDDLINLLNSISESKEFFKDIEFEDVFKLYKKNERIGKLPPDFPLFSDKVAFFGSELIFATKDNFKEYYMKLRNNEAKIAFHFDHLVNFFLCSSFNGAYIIVDDFERIPDFQSDRQKRDFALEIRTNFFDGVSLNAKIGFYNLFLMLHAGVPRLIEKAWSDSGLEQRSPISAMSASSRHIIPFEKLSPKHITLLIKKYLSEYRIKDEKNQIYPFEQSAIKKIGELTELNAATILKLACTLIECAVDENLESINVEFVERVLEKTHKAEDRAKNITDEKTTDLSKKINN